MPPLTENRVLSRFERREGGNLVYADFRIESGVLILPHVEADPALRGKGAAGRLMSAVLDLARQRELRVRPVCSYAAAFIDRHPEHQDLLE